MTISELIKALRCLKIQTNSFACLGCGHEHNCGIHGCAIIREAAEKLGYFNTVFHEDAVTNDPNPAPWENGLKLAGQCLKVEPGRLRELAEADREGRLFLLPLEPGRSMFCHFERPWVMKNVAPCVQYQSSVGIVFYMGYDVFRGLVEHGKITPLSPEGEKALEAMKDE